MLSMSRLTIVRQRRVAQSLSELFADKAATKALHAEVRTALGQTVEVGARLDAGRELPPLLLDNTTDTVTAALHDVLDAIERGLDDRVVKPLSAAQAKKKAAASTLLQRVFPDGTPFLSLSMPLQYDAMRTVMDLLQKDAECVAAVGELGLGYFVDHLAAHMAPYGRAVTSADHRNLEAEGDAFHAAFVRLAVLVAAHHGGNEAIDKQVLGAYQTELDAQRQDERDARRRLKKKREAQAAG